MSTGTRIEWSETTWNPTTGCDRVSPGCDNCYALSLAGRLKAMGSEKYQLDGDPRTSGPGFGAAWHDDALDLPLRWRKPRMVFVDSMSDLFHDAIPDEFIGRVWAVMAATPQHTYQILTKRHGRMRSLVSGDLYDLMCRAMSTPEAGPAGLVWPLPNVWLGVSAEDQLRATLRIPALLQTPAAVRWVSCEPLLGPIHLYDDWLAGTEDRPTWLDWVVVGGESGRGARPMMLGWAQSLARQCKAAGVPLFVKQLGIRWGAKHHDMNLFPAGLRVRQYPERHQP